MVFQTHIIITTGTHSILYTGLTVYEIFSAINIRVQNKISNAMSINLYISLHDIYIFTVHCEKDPLGYIMGDYDDEQTGKSDSENISFKSCSLKYITQPRSFVQELENCGLDESTIYSSCLESSDDEVIEEIDNEEIDNNDDGFLAFSGNRKRRRRKEKSEMREKLSKVIDLSQAGKPKCDVKKLSEISDIVLCVQENFPLVDPANITANQSASLQWLIHVCSEIIQCSVDILQSELVRFQVSMFAADNLTNRRIFLQDVANQ